MSEIIENDTINLKALSKYNGESETENAKKIIQILAQKAKFYNIPQTV
ncbi:hypothetical protein LCGC14_0922410, partial [marine sediment metagenome]